MPQMSPLMWLVIYFYMLVLFYLLNLILYSYIMFKKNTIKSNDEINLLKKFIFKW